MSRSSLASHAARLASVGIVALLAAGIAPERAAHAAPSEPTAHPTKAAHAVRAKHGATRGTKRESDHSKKGDLPKASSEPLPSLAANMTTPLAAPIGTSATPSAEHAHAHGAEPRRTPIVRASTRTHAKASAPKPPCLHDAMTLTRGTEEERLSLTKCDGSVAPLAVEHLSILVRPGSVAKPHAAVAELAKAHGADLAPGIRRVDPRLVERLQAIVDHFGKKGDQAHVSIVSGYRPSSAGSFHASGKALDFRIDGVKNEEIVAFCKTLPDTGCGYYPNSSFVHVDVRLPGTGHVSWIDASGPGEKPEYVAAWPPPKEDKDGDVDAEQVMAQVERELEKLPPPVHEDEHGVIATHPKAKAAPAAAAAPAAPAVMAKPIEEFTP